jgi:hypothetical protein
MQQESFFDMPAGYSDADMDMARLEELGNQHARRVRKYGEQGYAAMQAGDTITQPCRSKATGEDYTAYVRLEDNEVLYTVDGREWFGTAREAHAARWNA